MGKHAVDAAPDSTPRLSMVWDAGRRRHAAPVPTFVVTLTCGHQHRRAYNPPTPGAVMKCHPSCDTVAPTVEWVTIDRGQKL